MPVLIAAVVVVGALCLLDLLLTLGVIRRLREHTAMLAAGGAAAAPPVTELAIGESPAPFSVTAVSGQRVNGPVGLRVVAFFSPGCPACPERVPPFVEYLASNAIARESVLAVIEDSEDDLPSYLDTLAGVAQVCADPGSAEVSHAFKIRGYPVFCLLDADGTMVASSIVPAGLTEPAGV